MFDNYHYFSIFINRILGTHNLFSKYYNIFALRFPSTTDLFEKVNVRKLWMILNVVWMILNVVWMIPKMYFQFYSICLLKERIEAWEDRLKLENGLN